MSIVRHWLAAALAFLAVAYVLPGFQVRSLMAALIAAAVLGLLNALVKPVLVLLTLPLTLLTLGLFSLVLNALLMALVAALVPGIHISGFGAAFLGALGVWAVTWAIDALLRTVLR